MADNVTYRFIQNVGDYFPSGYFTEDFINKVKDSAGSSPEDMSRLSQPFVELRTAYEEYKNSIINDNLRVKDAIEKTHKWNSKLLQVLGYDTSNPYTEPYVVNEKDGISEMIPVRHILRSGDKISMLVMEMQNLVSINDQLPPGLFEQQYGSDAEVTSREQRYYASQWEYVIPKIFLDKEKYRFSPSIINKAITQIFLMQEERRPRFILMLAGNVVFLFNQEKWSRGSYLQFSLDDLYAQGQIKAMRNYYALFYLLVSKETLSADGQTVLMDTLIEESYKSAYEVTKDLKEGVILAVETLANEALFYMKNIVNKPFGKRRLGEDGEEYYDETDDEFESEVKDDCITIVYRLLFVLFAESRPELEILPIGDEVYKNGYSLEALRDMEQVPLFSQESRDGYFFDDSIKRLFYILSHGYHQEAQKGDKSFSTRPLDSPLFDDDRLNHLKDVRIRNIKWQEIIKSLSLSRGNKYCGRISYANLGINQLGSVYESLLAYRGFYAEEDYIEVHEEEKPEEGTFLVPYSRMEAFKMSEILCDRETGEIIKLSKGTFVYRLNGRDRQKSASYYTPEVLTRSTVKYTLKAIIKDVASGKRKATELLDLKILEPAMGAAAFQNEVINQLAEAYLLYQQQQKKASGCPNWQIPPDHYRDELQKVKAYIATHNVYGVDLNPTAIELGKLSLWLNAIHKDMETPFFSNRLALGNAVIGAWLKVYDKDELYGIKGSKKLMPNPWWEKAPHKLKFGKNSVKRQVNEIYHFLLPQKTMLAVRTIKEQKKMYLSEVEQMKKILKDWAKPIDNDDFIVLQRLSKKIDVLLKEYFQFQQSIESITQNRMALWGVPGTIQGDMFISENYATKEQLNDTRYRHDNAYFRLKMVMDYWCSLWFWDYDKTLYLPKRSEYWSDIEAMLDVCDDSLDRQTAKALNVHADSNGQLKIFSDGKTGDIFMQHKLSNMLHGNNTSYANKEAESEIIRLTKEDILAKTQGTDRGFFDDSKRFAIVKQYADRYHFFHPMLEFLEVFWLRGGFDIICGNPPWIKMKFDETGIISEKYPEVIIRKTSAPKVREKKYRMFEESPSLKRMYQKEEMEMVCLSSFMKAYCNYPLTQGQKVNLYKCVLENGFSMLSDNGYMGLLHPESIYDDPKGQSLRREIYPRLRYFFQYINELSLFSEVGHRFNYGEHIYSSKQENVDFLCINDLFHPSTIDACFVHNGNGICGGLKTEDNKWNTDAHHDRIVHFTENELRIISDTFESGSDWQSVKFASIHANILIGILEKLGKHSIHIRDHADYIDKIITASIDETSGVDDGLITKNISTPSGEYDVVLNGPHIYVSTPFYKTSLEENKGKNDFSCIRLLEIDSSFIPRTVYTACQPHSDQYLNHVKGLFVGQDINGNNVYDRWIDHYKFAYRSMLNLGSEHTLVGCILPPKWNHINGLNSIIFKDRRLLVEFTSLCSSIVLDFFLKVIGSSNLHPERLVNFPIGVADKYKSALFVRTLMLNCLSMAYSKLWHEMWRDEYRDDEWSIKDKRLKSFSTLTSQWQWATPLRNDFERRQALLEIDVIVALALGLSLEDLVLMYNIQFSVLYQNEKDTWYDEEGKIVFTSSKGLKNVGLSPSLWKDIRGEASEDGMSFQGQTSSYIHVSVNSDSSNDGQVEDKIQNYYAPYTRCDRIADYKKAWAYFEKRFNK